MKSNLPPLDFTEEVEKYEAKQESATVDFPKCTHKNTKIENGSLKCTCGVRYYGSLPQLLELQKHLSR